MVRPRKGRCLHLTPPVRFFKPQGVPVRTLQTFVLRDEGMEALALVDVKGKDHESAAALMNVSRPTFSRILTEARRAVAQAITSGSALRIEPADTNLSARKDEPDATA